MRAGRLLQGLQRLPEFHEEAVCVSDGETSSATLVKQVLRETAYIAARCPVERIAPRWRSKDGRPQRCVPLTGPPDREQPEIIEDLVQRAFMAGE
jgi:hypothetical protein